ncbi:MAG TPA: phosphate acyltransferase, partial [Aestuariivirga sp.]|nr:phosphate acyltransferase [Aestuariivirga sp.]
MPDSLTLSLDAMGGDAGPEMVLPAAAIAAERHPKIDFLLFGDEQRLRPLLDLQPRLKPRARIHHCDVAIAMNDKPSQALRQGRGKSSMWQTVDAVKRGEAHAAVSAG